MTGTRLHRSFAPLKRLLPPAVHRPLRAVATAVVTPVRFALLSGHFRSSLRSRALDTDGGPLPWYTYPAIDFLRARSFEGRRVLEFGGGQSTLWWSQRAASVLTIEEDAAWFAETRARVGDNVSIHHVPIGEPGTTLARVRDLIAASGISRFDVVVVDGHMRREMTALAFEYLAPGGAIILDNAEGYGFYEEVRDRACRRVDFFGFCPGVALRHCTSLVYVDDCFLLRPEIPIPVIEHVGV